jgi:hypothetical protein
MAECGTFWEVAEDFMRNILNLKPDGYLLTDDSCLDDFVGFGIEIEDLQRQIRQEYGLDVSSVKTGNLFEIFRRIHRIKYGTRRRRTGRRRSRLRRVRI